MIGTTVARHKIVSKLRGGGMGVVCEAEDVEPGRHVAESEHAGNRHLITLGHLPT